MGSRFSVYFFACYCQDRLWPDQWTAVTADGSRSAQFEHTLLVTKKGVEVLTAPLSAADIVRSPPGEASDASGAQRVKCPPHLAEFARAVGVEVELDAERYAARAAAEASEAQAGADGN